jgi:Tfp pilus assembly protein PilZ
VPNDLPSLRVSFESPEVFQREFDSNLTNGGAFVRTEENFALRQAVDVELCFEYSGHTLTLRAEIVHIIPPEMAGVGGAPGVAVQFQMPVRDLREQLGALAIPVPESGVNVDSGQRGSQRKPVRVAAQIQGDREVISGHTRNLSLTGVLVGVGGQALALGEIVSVTLEHPTTGEQKTIPGRVARQVVSNGEVSALAIEFTLNEAEREETERFVETLQSVEHTRRLGGISGPIGDIGPQSLLQMFATSSQRGTLMLRCDQEEGVICFDAGLLRLAQLGSTTGMKALVRMLSWRTGVFEFHARIDEREIKDAPFPLEAALFDAVRQIDEGATVDQKNFPLRAKLARRAGGDLDAFATPSKVEAAVLDLATAGFTVQRALEVIPEPDPEIFKALQALVEAELLTLES